MAIQLNKLPNYSDFYSSGLYGSYSNTVTSLGVQQLAEDLWEEFKNLIFPELQGFSDFSTDKEIDSEKIFASKSFGMDRYVSSLLKENIREFFTQWLPSKNLTTNSITTIKSAFTQFLNDNTRSPSTKKTATIFYWAWFLLLKQLKHIQQTSLNKAKSALIFSYGEQAAVTQMSKIQFQQQSSDSDYATIKHNMDAQQKAESQRNWRSIVGKNTSIYQNDVQVSNDARAQISQMATKMMQEIESIATSITRIG